MCVPYDFLMLKKKYNVSYINIYIHMVMMGMIFFPSSLHAARACHLLFIHFFCCCRHLAIWQFTLRTEKKPTEISQGWKKSSHLWKPGPSTSKKKKANDVFFEGGNFGKKCHQNQPPKGGEAKLYEFFGAKGRSRIPNCWGTVTHPTFTRNPFNEWVYEKTLLLGCLCFWLGRTRTSPRWLPK